MKKQKKNKSRFCDVCPRKLNNLPDAPCPLAMMRLELMKSGKRESPDLPGCPYAITERQHNYCFWSLADSEDFGPMTTKEIGKSLSLTSAQIEKAEKSALNTLKEMGQYTLLKKWAEAVKDAHDYVHDIDNIYTNETYSSLCEIAGEDTDLPLEVKNEED